MTEPPRDSFHPDLFKPQPYTDKDLWGCFLGGIMFGVMIMGFIVAVFR